MINPFDENFKVFKSISSSNMTNTYRRWPSTHLKEGDEIAVLDINSETLMVGRVHFQTKDEVEGFTLRSLDDFDQKSIVLKDVEECKEFDDFMLRRVVTERDLLFYGIDHINPVEKFYKKAFLERYGIPINEQYPTEEQKAIDNKYFRGGSLRKCLEGIISLSNERNYKLIKCTSAAHDHQKYYIFLFIGNEKEAKDWERRNKELEEDYEKIKKMCRQSFIKEG